MTATLIENAHVVGATPDRVRQILARLTVAPSGCWEWQGAHVPTGHGKLYIGDKHWYVYRLMWALHTGEPIPPRHELHHECENPPCANPTHLACLTHRDHAHETGLSGRAAVHAAMAVCKWGHPFDGHNGYQRTCSICSRRRKQEWAQRNPRSSP